MQFHFVKLKNPEIIIFGEFDRLIIFVHMIFV